MNTTSARGGATAEPRRIGSALILASIVTLAAVIPLAILALRADDGDPAATTAGLTVDRGDGAEPLSGAVIDPSFDASLNINGDDLVAAAWSLMTPDGFLLAEGRAVGAPPYPVDLPAGLLAGLEPGLYDLLVTTTLADGSNDRRAARFAIGDR